MPPKPKLRKVCTVCGGKFLRDQMKSGRCKPCYNAWRRERYEYDPEYRLRRIQSSVTAGTSQEKRAAATRRYRQRKAQAQIQANNQKEPQ